MTVIKSKLLLKQHVEEAFVPIKQLMVSLKWTKAVDLDLMAFYKSKDGQVGGVFSDQYPGGTRGDLYAFPFIQLDQDAGLGATAGENQETIRITKLDDMAEVYICTLNYSDAAQGKEVSFAEYDGHVVVVDDTGESFGIPLESTDKGHAVVIAKIDNTNPIGAKLINENKVMSLSEFFAKVPGADILSK